MQVAVQQQDLDQSLGALGLAQPPGGLGPQRLVHCGEDALAAGLVQCFGSGQCSGLGQQHLQVMVQHDAFGAAAAQPRMLGDLAAAVIDQQFFGVQHDVDLAADQVDRYRVSAHFHRDQ
ncbi:hypothetical protein ETD83_13200 [Actinomadura soli]|uniref:Uncharacterized protein n=1 Tax=Actinomadura soli TaxID=2508997 RepID=A0A5C4JFR2_9ACTN|nr:hypothetical protein [Actinomadura soli]TMR02170.1 hypothetical protein ETD83_13200 [Actinomadura soli]